MHIYTEFLIFLGLLVILPDLYLYNRFMRNRTNKSTSILHAIISIYSVTMSLTIMLNINNVFSPETNFRLILLVTVLGLIYLPKLAFCTFDLVFFLTKKRWRSIQYCGYVAAITIALTILHGIFIKRFDFKKGEYVVPMEHLPAAFENYKIVQISDFHLGTFSLSKEKLIPLMDSINAQKPDLIVFTGDMVNSLATECNGWNEIFDRLDPQTPKLAILGNHDYSTYYMNWGNEDVEFMNSMAIRQRIRDFGFDLLLNESVTIPKGNDTIAIIGTENWSKKKEYNYGDIPKSMKGTEHLPCKIMLTHDPSFWEDSICGKLDVDLTLSGHTHASQIGFEIGNFKWSPAKYRFEQYDGLTEKNGEYILVSRGIGCVGVPVRIGLSPEYSVITLKSKKQ